MKKLIIIISLIVAGLAVNDVMAQVVVTTRPVAPRVVVVKKVRAQPGRTWIAGHWVWHARRGQYVWKAGYWVRSRPHQRYVAGRWVSVGRRGYRWVPGYWTRA